MTQQKGLAMQNNGDFEIYVKSPVIYGIPLITMDSSDLDRYYAAIVQAAESMDKWILFENPQINAATTTLAMETTLSHYQKLSTQGCSGIALLMLHAIARVVRYEKELASLPIPFMASKNQIELARFVEGLVLDIEAGPSSLQNHAG